MVNINSLFRTRIGFSPQQPINFENVTELLQLTAKTIPFENICILNHDKSQISNENLASKILLRNEGGLCYELNSILYLFLKENGFQVNLVRGAVYNHVEQNWNKTGRTHVTILLQHNDETYLVDTGFGGNLPLAPVPLDGKIVKSDNGEFQVKQVPSDYGNYIFYMKLKYKDNDWKIGYSFDSKNHIEDLSQLNEIKETIRDSIHSAFNKAPLLTKRTDTGQIILTDTSFTIWQDGKMTKEEINDQTFTLLAKQHFKMNV